MQVYFYLSIRVWYESASHVKLHSIDLPRHRQCDDSQSQCMLPHMLFVNLNSLQALTSTTANDHWHEQSFTKRCKNLRPLGPPRELINVNLSKWVHMWVYLFVVALVSRITTGYGLSLFRKFIHLPSSNVQACSTSIVELKFRTVDGSCCDPSLVLLAPSFNGLE